MKIVGDKKARNPLLDYIKAFAIILVIIGHAIQLGSGDTVLKKCYFFEDPLYKFIYSFHMPLFMIISGYLFYSSICKYDFKNNLMKKIFSIIIPLLSWNIIITAIDLSKSNENITIKRIFTSYVNEFLGNLWFLWAVFLCSIIVLLVNKFLRDNIFAYLCIFLLTFLTPDRMIVDVFCYKYMYPYFVFGYLFCKYDWNKALKIIKYKYLFIPIFLMYFIMLFFYNNDIYIYNSGISIYSKDILSQLYIDFYRLAIGLLGSLLIIYLFFIISKSISGVISKIFLYIGKRTMGIYIITNFIFIYVVPELTKNFTGINYAVILVESIICLVISLGFIFIIEHIPLLNKIFLGGR